MGEYVSTQTLVIYSHSLAIITLTRFILLICRYLTVVTH